jgi:hypothetical protein
MKLLIMKVTWAVSTHATFHSLANSDLCFLVHHSHQLFVPVRSLQLISLAVINVNSTVAQIMSNPVDYDRFEKTGEQLELVALHKLEVKVSRLFSFAICFRSLVRYGIF